MFVIFHAKSTGFLYKICVFRRSEPFMSKPIGPISDGPRQQRIAIEQSQMFHHRTFKEIRRMLMYEVNSTSIDSYLSCPERCCSKGWEFLNNLIFGYGPSSYMVNCMSSLDQVHATTVCKKRLFLRRRKM